MTAINVNFSPESSILILSKDAVLDQKQPFRDPSRFDRLSVTMPQCDYASVGSDQTCPKSDTHPIDCLYLTKFPSLLL